MCKDRDLNTDENTESVCVWVCECVSVSVSVSVCVWVNVCEGVCEWGCVFEFETPTLWHDYQAKYFICWYRVNQKPKGRDESEHTQVKLV